MLYVVILKKIFLKTTCAYRAIPVSKATLRLYRKNTEKYSQKEKHHCVFGILVKHLPSLFYWNQGRVSLTTLELAH